MRHLTLIILIVNFSIPAYSQQDFFHLKKSNRTITTYRQGYYIAFQTRSRQWITGEITKIQNDSFFVRPRIIRFSLMNVDTTYFPVMGIALADVVLLPKKGVKIDFIKGQLQLNTAAGHVHWYWIKNGLLFRVGGGGFALLTLINGLSKNVFVFGIAAAFYILGEFLHRTFKVTMKMGKKYHLHYIKLSG
jgi:hypothetical protein